MNDALTKFWRHDATVPPLRVLFPSSTIVLAECMSRHVARSMGMDEEREDLTTQEMAEQAEVTIRTVQRWLKSGKLKAETLPHGKYRVNPFDLVELSLPLTERAAATPKKRRLSYDELHDAMIQLTFEVEALDIRLEKAERTIEQLKKQGTSTSRTVPTSAKKKRTTSKARSTTLPRDLVTWRSFARLHDIPERSVAKAIKEGLLWPEQGYWKVKGVVVKEALDYGGRKQFVELFERFPTFRECDECPHSAHAW